MAAVGRTEKFSPHFFPNKTIPLTPAFQNLVGMYAFVCYRPEATLGNLLCTNEFTGILNSQPF